MTKFFAIAAQMQGGLVGTGALVDAKPNFIHSNFFLPTSHFFANCKKCSTFAFVLKRKYMDTQVKYMDILQRFKEEHGSEYGITRIGIFGSVARNEHTEESDVDVVVEAPVMGLFSRMGIKYKLEEMMGVPVDVVRKSEYMRTRFKARIEKEVIYV